MGYSGLKNVNSSDTASDLAYGCERAYLKELSNGLKVQENEFNTSGWINVALIIESGALDSFCSYSDEFEKFDWEFLIKKLEREVIESSSNVKYKSQWECEENRQMHHKAFKRMCSNVKKFLRKKEIDVADFD
jgi:hypothetical protein